MAIGIPLSDEQFMKIHHLRAVAATVAVGNKLLNERTVWVCRVDQVHD
jgi:hypothetical protein